MKNNSKKVKKLAAVTGASSGIGYELAKVFAKNNYDVLIVAEDDGIFDAANAIHSLGVEVSPVQADLSTFQGVEKFYAAIKSCKQPLDALVLNAGVGVGGEFTKTDLAAELNMIQLNITSTVHLAKRVIADFITQKSGKILITSSVAAEMPGPYYAVYAATKAFVQSFAEAIRHELADTGIVVTSLQPGATDTNFFARAHMIDTPAGQAKKDDPAQVAQDGFDALMAGKDHVIAGSFMNKMNPLVGRILPETQSAKIQGKQAKPNSLKDK